MPKLYLNRAWVREKLGDPRAVEDNEKAVALDPQNVETLCLVLHAIGDFATTRKARICGAPSPLLPMTRGRHIQLANVLGEVFRGYPGMPRPNAPEALEHYARAIQLAPASYEAYHQRGLLYWYLERNDRALADVSRALEMKPDYYWAFGSQSGVLQAIGEYDKRWPIWPCSPSFSRIIRSVHSDIGGIHLHRGNWQAAVDAFTKSLEISPSSFHAFQKRAMAYVNLGQYPQALADLRRALELVPREWNLNWASIPGRKVVDAPEEFRQGVLELAQAAIDQSTNPGTAYINRGFLHELMNNFEKADTDITKAVQVGVKSTVPGTGWLSTTCEGRTGRRQRTLSRRRWSAPDDAEMNNNAAWYLVTCPDSNVWNPQRAVERAKRATELQPTIGGHWKRWA